MKRRRFSVYLFNVIQTYETTYLRMKFHSKASIKKIKQRL